MGNFSEFLCVSVSVRFSTLCSHTDLVNCYMTRKVIGNQWSEIARAFFACKLVYFVTKRFFSATFCFSTTQRRNGGRLPFFCPENCWSAPQTCASLSARPQGIANQMRFVRKKSKCWLDLFTGNTQRNDSKTHGLL